MEHAKKDRKKRNKLTLKTRYEIIKEVKTNSRSNARSLDEKFDCGKTQVYSILKERLQLFSNMNVMHLLVPTILCSKVENLLFKGQ